MLTELQMFGRKKQDENKTSEHLYVILVKQGHEISVRTRSYLITGQVPLGQQAVGL